MAIDKGKIDAGQGGKRGHSNMDHWVYSHELKDASRKARRLDAKRAVRSELAEAEGAAAPQQPVRKTASARLRAAKSPSSAGNAVEARRRVRAYLDALPPDARRVIVKMRSAIRSAVPRGEEGFSYGIPCVRRDGKVVVWYAAWKKHAALYPIGPDLTRDMRDAPAGYEVSKGTIRFPFSNPPPAALVRRLVKARMALLRAGDSAAK